MPESGETEVTNYRLNEKEDLFISELRDKIRNYENKVYEKNGFTYFRFIDYSLRINTEFYNSIKSKL